MKNPDCSVDLCLVNLEEFYEVAIKNFVVFILEGASSGEILCFVFSFGFDGVSDECLPLFSLFDGKDGHGFRGSVACDQGLCGTIDAVKVFCSRVLLPGS